MKEIINWLREIEHLANEVYEMAASIYADDPKFKRFLELNANNGVKRRSLENNSF